MMTRSMSYAYFSSAFFPVMVLATGAGTILVLWFGGHDVVSGRITLGQFVQFNAILVLLANQLIATGWVVTAYQQGTASLRRVNEVLRAVPAIADSSDPQRAGAHSRRHRVPRCHLRLRCGEGAGRRQSQNRGRARPWRWSARPAPARRPSSTCW